jgi:hypothetical protein
MFCAYSITHMRHVGQITLMLLVGRPFRGAGENCSDNPVSKARESTFSVFDTKNLPKILYKGDTRGSTVHHIYLPCFDVYSRPWSRRSHITSRGLGFSRRYCDSSACCSQSGSTLGDNRGSVCNFFVPNGAVEVLVRSAEAS